MSMRKEAHLLMSWQSTEDFLTDIIDNVQISNHDNTSLYEHIMSALFRVHLVMKQIHTQNIWLGFHA